MTGDFDEEGLIDDVAGLSSSDYIGLDEWIGLYHKDYRLFFVRSTYFRNQLNQNMTTDCSLNYKFSIFCVHQIALNVKK